MTYDKICDKINHQICDKIIKINDKIRCQRVDNSQQLEVNQT